MNPPIIPKSGISKGSPKFIVYKLPRFQFCWTSRAPATAMTAISYCLSAIARVHLSISTILICISQNFCWVCSNHASKILTSTQAEADSEGMFSGLIGLHLLMDLASGGSESDTVIRTVFLAILLSLIVFVLVRVLHWQEWPTDPPPHMIQLDHSVSRHQLFLKKSL